MFRANDAPTFSLLMTKWVLLALRLPRLVWYPAMELPDNYLLAPAPHAIKVGNS